MPNNISDVSHSFFATVWNGCKGLCWETNSHVPCSRSNCANFFVWFACACRLCTCTCSRICTWHNYCESALSRDCSCFPSLGVILLTFLESRNLKLVSSSLVMVFFFCLLFLFTNHSAICISLHILQTYVLMRLAAFYYSTNFLTSGDFIILLFATVLESTSKNVLKIKYRYQLVELGSAWVNIIFVTWAKSRRRWRTVCIYNWPLLS